MKILPRRNYSGTILGLALPVIAGLSSQMILSITDTAMVGRIADAQYTLAAMGLGLFATWAIVSFCSSFSTGTHVLVARRFGELNYRACKDVLVNSILLTFTFGLVIAALGMLWSKPLALTFSNDPKVGMYAGEYMFYRFIGLPFFMITVSYRGFFFGIGNTKVFMLSAILMNVVNVILNYMFIFGEWGAPEMGLAGASLASSIATIFDAGFHYAASIFVRKFREPFELYKRLRIVPEIIKNIFKISIPVSFQNVFTLLGFFLFLRIIGFVGTLEQAASQAVISTLYLSILPCNGFGVASQTFIGNYVGRKQTVLARVFGFETAKIASYYTVFLAILFMLFPRIFLIITTDDSAIIDTAVPALRIAAVAQIFYATGIVMASGLQAAGKTLYVMFVEFASNLLIFVPIAFLLSSVFGLGLVGAWLALPFYTITHATLMYLKFRFQKWNQLGIL